MYGGRGHDKTGHLAREGWSRCGTWLLEALVAGVVVDEMLLASQMGDSGVWVQWACEADDGLAYLTRHHPPMLQGQHGVFVSEAVGVIGLRGTAVLLADLKALARGLLAEVWDEVCALPLCSHHTTTRHIGGG